jgi:small subunit ribosomal protein S16
MVRIRMQRFGRTHRPFYRINAIDIRTRRNGKVIENLGWYNPMAKEGEEQINLKEDRIKEWLEKGARPSDTVMDMLGNRDLLSDKMKAEWEAGRALDRDRVTCKQALAKAEAALKELEALGESSDADPAPLIEKAQAAVAACKKSVSHGRTAAAEKALAEAEAARDELKKADDAKKAAEAAEAEKKAAEEAAAAEAEPAEEAPAEE